MRLCYVTDRKALSGSPDTQIQLLLDRIENAARAGVNWIQVREKDLTGKPLLTLLQEAKRRVAAGCRILVNDRLDVALAAGADGAHLGERSLPVGEARRLLRERHMAAREFLLGVSTHSVQSVCEAAAGGADYVIFGPVFATPSKLPYGAPQGVEQLAEACRSVSIPVIAIGGITVENARECIAAGAAGIAAIRLFQDRANLAATVLALTAKAQRS